MHTVLAAIVVVLMAGAAQAQEACRSTGTPVPAGGTGTAYLAATMTVPRGGQCSLSAYGQASQLRVVTPPHNGHLEVGNGAIRYIANQGYAAPDTFVFARDA